MVFAIIHFHGYTQPSGILYPKELGVLLVGGPAGPKASLETYHGVANRTNRATVSYINNHFLLDGAVGECHPKAFIHHLQTVVRTCETILVFGSSQVHLLQRIIGTCPAVLNLQDIMPDLPTCKELAKLSTSIPMCPNEKHRDVLGGPCSANVINGFQHWHDTVSISKLCDHLV
jgi:hypothetical protein